MPRGHLGLHPPTRKPIREHEGVKCMIPSIGFRSMANETGDRNVLRVKLTKKLPQPGLLAARHAGSD